MSIPFNRHEQLMDGVLQENKKLKELNKSLFAYINSIEEQLLQMNLKNSFYEGMFEEQTPKPCPTLMTSKPLDTFKEQESMRNETRDATPKPHPLEKKIKKSKVKTNPQREPRYHITEVARDWSS